MTDDTQALLRRIEALEGRVSVLEQPKTRRKRATQASSGNINLDDDGDLFATTPVRALTATKEEVSFGEIDLGTLD